MRKATAIWLGAALAAACGARSALDGPFPVDATVASDAGVDAGADTSPLLPVACVPGEPPAVLAVGMPDPNAQIAVATDAVYYSTGDGLALVSKRGGPSAVVTSGFPEVGEGLPVEALALGTDGVYFGNASFYRVALGAGPETTRTIGVSGGASFAALDRTYVYAAQFAMFYLDAGSGSAVIRIPRAGGPPVALVGGAYSNGYRSVAVNATHVFVTNIDAPAGVAPAVTQFAIDGSDPVPLGPDGDGFDVALDESFVYWTDRSAGVRRADLATRAVEWIVREEDESVLGIAVDTGGVTGHLYWGSAAGLRRASKDGTGAALLFPSGAGGVARVALDETCVYWTTAGDGSEPPALHKGPK